MTNNTDTPGKTAWLIMLTVIFMLIQATNTIQVLQLGGNVVQQISLPAWLNASLSLIWFVLFGFAAVSLIRRKAFATGYTAWVFMLFFLYSLLRLLVFARADYDRTRLPLLVGLILIGLIVAVTVRIRSTRKTIRHTRG